MFKKWEIGSICALLEGQIFKPTISFADWRPEPPQPPQLSTRIKRLPWDTVLRGGVYLTIICAVFLIQIKLHFSMFIWSYGLVGWGAVYSKFSRAPESVKEMMDFPQVVSQYPVRVSIFRNGIRIGRDVGVVTFSGDLLHFEGRKTSFGFARRDIFLTASPKNMSPKNFFRAFVAWNYQNSQGKMQIVPYGRVSGSKKVYGSDFKAAMVKWESSKSAPKNHSILPPRYPLDAEIRKAEALGRAALWIIGGLAPPTLCLLGSVFFDGFRYLWLVFCIVLTEIALIKYVFSPQKEKVVLLESALNEELDRKRRISICQEDQVPV
jgi:hypothetical protein